MLKSCINVDFLRTLIKSCFVFGLLFSFVILSGVTVVAAYDNLVYIKADGTVEGTDLIQRNGSGYSFLSDVTVEESGNVDIFVELDNTVIDGAGFSLQGFEDGAGIILMGRNNVTIKNLYGSVALSNCTHCFVNRIQGMIWMEHSFNNTITENNLIFEDPAGLMMVYSHNNTVHKNYASNDKQGISLINSENNTITENTMANNTQNGLGLWDSNNNFIVKNNFMNNTEHTADFQFVQNVWDNGAEGNYWDTYNGTDANNNGIGDTPFMVPTSNPDETPVNTDNYPLINPVEVETIVIPEFPMWAFLPLFLVAALTVILYRKKLTTIFGSNYIL